jgi:hypothetical protein
MNVPLLSSRSRTTGLGLGLGLLALCAIYGFFDPAPFFEGYLTAFIFWVEVALGCVGLLLLQYLTGGRWGTSITRLLEAGMMTLPLCAVLFLPVFLGLPYLFPWIHPTGRELPHLVHEKAVYLNLPFFVFRYLVYFGSLSGLAFFYRGLSLRRDRNEPGALETMKKWSGPCLIVFVLLMNFACVDWVMSLNPEWYSSMLTVEFVAEQAVVTLAGCILVLRFLSWIDAVRQMLSVKVVHDLGNLLLGFTCFWTYVTFADYLITWTGNLPHEVSWFSDRSSAGWKIFAVVLVLVHFVVPMFLLIFTWISKNLVRLARVAGLMIFAHFLQVLWWVEPAFRAQAHFAWCALVLIPALGAIWLANYVRHLESAPLLLPEPANPVEVAA